MQFLAGLSNMASVTFTIYFLSHGLSQLQIGELFGFFMLCMSLFNIPTGTIADIFGHKISVAIGVFLQALCFLIFFLYPNFYGFLLGMFFSGLGWAFQAGAISSLIYELLEKENLHQNFQKVFGRTNVYFLAGTIIGSPFGSIIYKFYPALPYLLSFIFLFSAAFFIFIIKWEFKKKPYSIKYYYRTLTKGIFLTIKNKILMATVIIGIALTVNRMVFNQNIAQPYQLSIGIDVAYFGIIAAAISLVEMPIYFYAHRITEKIGESFSLLLIVLIPSICAILLSFINTLLAIPIIMIFFTGHAFRDPLFSHISQKEADHDKRSTMASTVSFMITIIAALMLPFWGKGVDLFGLHNSLFLLGSFSFIIGALGLILFETKKHKNYR